MTVCQTIITLLKACFQQQIDRRRHQNSEPMESDIIISGGSRTLDKGGAEDLSSLKIIIFKYKKSKYQIFISNFFFLLYCLFKALNLYFCYIFNNQGMKFLK
jgi:hypothetical protein